jgi:hypothetical protein
VTDLEPFRIPYEETKDGVLHQWGVRRLDGQPWRHEPRLEGDSSYYVLGDEISPDGMVLHSMDVIDAINALLSQHDGDGGTLPQPGEVAVVQRVFRSYPDDPQHPGWRTWWVDVDDDELARHLTLMIQTCARLLPDLAVLTHIRKADQ